MNEVNLLEGVLLSDEQIKMLAFMIKPEDIKKIIESKDRSLAGKTLQPNGLYLVSVKYE